VFLNIERHNEMGFCAVRMGDLHEPTRQKPLKPSGKVVSVFIHEAVRHIPL
jgi:hypothetical protein